MYKLISQAGADQDVKSSSIALNHSGAGHYTLENNSVNACSYAGGWVLETPTKYGTYSQVFVMPGISDGLVAMTGLAVDQKTLTGSGITSTVVERPIQANLLASRFGTGLLKFMGQDQQTQKVLIINNDSSLSQEVLETLVKPAAISLSLQASN